MEHQLEDVPPVAVDARRDRALVLGGDGPGPQRVWQSRLAVTVQQPGASSAQGLKSARGILRKGAGK